LRANTLFKLAASFMRFPSFALDTLSFVVGFFTATIFWWVMGRMGPIWQEMREGAKKNREEAKARRSTSMEENFRRTILRRAQGMHLAAPLFALEEIIEPPLLIAPPARVEPGGPIFTEDIVARTVPYLPNWPELSPIYHADTLNLHQALGGESNLVITGQAGSGKTVALAYLASQIANRDEQIGKMSEAIPFLFHIADLHIAEGEYKEPLQPILNAAADQSAIFNSSRFENFAEYAFQNGRAILLLDGYDELAPEEQSQTSTYLEQLIESYPATQIVTTGTPEHLNGLLDINFEPLSLMPWSPTTSQAFIEKWGEIWMQTVAVESWAQSGPEQIDPLLINAWLDHECDTYTPLELTLKVWAGYAGDSLGPGILDALGSHVRRLAPSGTPLAALETLGMQVILSNQCIFDPRSAREWVKKFEIPDDLIESENIENEEGDSSSEALENEPKKKKSKRKKQKLTALPSTSGLLGKMTTSGLLVSHPNNRMRFLHPVLGGYLAGRALADFNAGETIFNQPDWLGKYLSMRYMAAYGNASKLVEDLLARTELPLHQHLFLAARWLRDAPRNASWSGKVFARLAELLQTEGIPLALRAQAITAFYWSGDPSAAHLFRQLLQTKSFELLQITVLGVGAIKDSKAVEQLSGVLYAPSLSSQRAACLALVSIGTPAALEAVARALLQGDEDLRRAAAESLANDPKEGHAMLKEGVSLKDILIRRAVVYGLARVDETWATESLQKIQLDDEQWVVRNSASEVLDSKSSSDPRIPRPLVPPSEAPWLIEFAGKLGVGISPGSSATDVLISALKSDNEEERLAALPYLKMTPTEGVLKSLYDAMFQDDSELRNAIFLVLCELASRGVNLPNPQKYGLG
jgi:HEAT repeat protein